MKIKDLERLELKKKIMNHKAKELFERARKICEKRDNYQSWSKWEKFWYCIPLEEIKNVQMELLEKEVEEYLKEKLKCQK